MKPRIAIIGAGMSGLVLAQHLKDHAEVIVFEKARGVGGRMSTHYAEPYYFDHGVHTFTARSKKFQQFLRPYIDSGTIAEWSGKVINLEIGKKITKRMWFETHLVASPNMNSLCKKLAEGITIKLGTEVAPLGKETNGLWHLKTKQGEALGEFDWVISTAPPAQTVNLFSGHLPLESAIHTIQMQGCYSLMLGFNRPWDKQWIAAKVRENPLGWISINSTKPDRNKDVTAIVAYSRNSWADEHMDDDMQLAQEFLISQFEAVTCISCTDAEYISTHRWKYAVVGENQKSEPYFDAERQLASTSDWCSDSRIEDVWTNAVKLAKEFTNIGI